MSQPLEQRILLLEKSLKWYRRGFLAFFAIVGSVLLLSFHSRKTNAPDVIQAKAFQVVDDDGHVLVELNQENNNGQLSTYSQAGKPLVSLFTSNDNTGGINTFDANGNVLFKVTNSSNGGGYLALFNPDGNEAVESGITDARTGYFRINDQNGDKQAWLSYTTDGGGYFSLSNAGKETVRMSTPQAGGRIGIYNGKGERVGYIGAQDNQQGNVTTWDASGAISGSLPANNRESRY